MKTENGPVLEENPVITSEELLDLYSDAGWTAYTKDPGRLFESYQNYLTFFSARMHGDLAGLLRCVGDGKTIVYIQDIIVKKVFRRKGIGSLLMRTVLEKFGDVRQIVLLTDENEENISFYRSAGFDKAAEKGLACFVRIR